MDENPSIARIRLIIRFPRDKREAVTRVKRAPCAPAPPSPEPLQPPPPCKLQPTGAPIGTVFASELAGREKWRSPPALGLVYFIPPKHPEAARHAQFLPAKPCHAHGTC